MGRCRELAEEYGKKTRGAPAAFKEYVKELFGKGELQLEKLDVFAKKIAQTNRDVIINKQLNKVNKKKIKNAVISEAKKLEIDIIKNKEEQERSERKSGDEPGKHDTTEINARVAVGTVQLQRRMCREAKGASNTYVLLNERETEKLIEETKEKEQCLEGAVAIIVACNPSELEDKKERQRKRTEVERRRAEAEPSSVHCCENKQWAV